MSDEKKVEERKAIDESVKLIMETMKDTTNPKTPEKIKYSVPVETTRTIMESQGVDRESLDNTAKANAHMSRSLHHVNSELIRKNILEHKHDKEFLGNVSVTGTAEIVRGFSRLQVETKGEREFNTPPQDGKPAGKCLKYGTGRTCIEITSAINEAREECAEEIKKTYEEIYKGK